jgi:YVTN family beta-propeller protein
MIDERLAVRIGLRLRPLRRHGLLRWALRSGAALAFVLPLLLFAPARLAQLASPLHTVPLPTTGAVAGLTVDPVLDRVFVVGADGTVWVLDGTGRRRLGAHEGGQPLGITGALGVDALRHRLYVATMAGGVEVLDGRTGAPDAPLPFAAVTGLAVDTTANRLLLSRPAGRSLTVLNAETRRVIATLAGTWVPGALAVDQTLRRVYVADVGSASLVMLDADTFATLTTVELGLSPAAIAVEPSTHRVYVVDPLGARLAEYAREGGSEAMAWEGGADGQR